MLIALLPEGSPLGSCVGAKRIRAPEYGANHRLPFAHGRYTITRLETPSSGVASPELGALRRWWRFSIRWTKAIAPRPTSR
jgi:hypothetical protein